MNIDLFFNKYKDLKKENVTICDNEEHFKYNEYSFDNYDIGVIANLNREDKYIVYLYVEANNDVISHLLFKEFTNPIDSTNYFNELSLLAKEGNLEKISLKISK